MSEHGGHSSGGGGGTGIIDKTTKQWDSMLKNVELMKKNPIAKVGVLEGAGLYHERISDGTTAVTEGKTVAQIATWNEFGTRTIPKRPAIRGTVENNLQAIYDMCAKAFERLTVGESDPHHELELIGLFTAGAVKKYIAAGVEPANAASTIARKKSSKPLIDTGQYRQAITHEVVESDTGGEGEVVSV